MHRRREIRVRPGDEVVTAEVGSFVWAPRDVTHAFCVESDEARFLAFSAGVEMVGRPPEPRTI